MLVSIACLLFIVIGLTAMFVEVQRAFKAGVRQSTMTDAGHTVIDLWRPIWRKPPTPGGARTP